MRTPGSADVLECRRWLAAPRIADGYSAQEVADFLGGDPSTARRWSAAFRGRGEAGLVAEPVSGRPGALTPTQEKIAPRWLTGSPTHHGLEDRAVDGGAARAVDPRGVRHRAQRPVSQHPAEGARAYPAGAGACAPRARPGGDRRGAEVGRAAHQKKARRRGARIALIDEGGLLMAPLARRTRAPRGQTPEREQKGGTREKVAVAAAVWLSPRRERLGLSFHTPADGYVGSRYVAAFPGAMRGGLPGRFVVVRDGGPMPAGDPIRDPMGHFADRLDLERLPPYAPTPNPVEPLRGWLEGGRSSNLGPRDAEEPDARAVAESAKVRDDQEFPRNLFHASDLPIPPALLS